MMKSIAFLVLILLIAICGCVSMSDVETAINDLASPCEKPLLQYGDACCMDRNANGICDMNETIKTQARPSTTTSSTSITSSTSTTPTETTSSSTTVSSTSSTTRTTVVKCKSDSDCGGADSRLVCKGSVIYNITTTFRCHNSTLGTYCLGAPKEEPVKQCKNSEYCLNGECTSTPDSECGYQCYLKGYWSSYCYSFWICKGFDVYVRTLSNCSNLNPYCCCRESTTTTQRKFEIPYPYNVNSS